MKHFENFQQEKCTKFDWRKALKLMRLTLEVNKDELALLGNKWGSV